MAEYRTLTQIAPTAAAERLAGGAPIEQKPVIINAGRLATAAPAAHDGAGNFLCVAVADQWPQGAPSFFTASDIAAILVEIEIDREKEKQPFLSAAAESRRRDEMLRGFPETASPEIIRGFESLARSLSEEQVRFQAREEAIAWLKTREQKLRRETGRLHRLLAKYPTRRWMELSKAAEKALAEPPMHFPKTWHDPARRIATAYMVNLDLGAAPSNDRFVRFVKAALRRIGAKPGDLKTIEGIISTAALLKTMTPPLPDF